MKEGEKGRLSLDEYCKDKCRWDAVFADVDNVQKTCTLTAG